MQQMGPPLNFPMYTEPRDQFFMEERMVTGGGEASSSGLRDFKKSDMKSTGLVLLCLVGALPAFAAFLLVTIYFSSLAHTSVPSPSAAKSWVTVPLVGTKPGHNPLVTIGHRPTVKKSEPCTTSDCRSQTQWLMQQMNFSADPCHDLYEFTCGNYRGHPEGPITEVTTLITSTVISSIESSTVPPSGQSAWQKAAGLFKACMALASSSSNEVSSLKAWLLSLRLDLANLSVARAVDPVEMAMRCSLDFGVPAVFAVTLFERQFIEGKRAMELRFSHSEELWHRHRHQLLTISVGEAMAFYTAALTTYGVDGEHVMELTNKIMSYENELISALNRHLKTGIFTNGRIQDMGLITQPHVTPDQWAGALAKYTNGTYNGSDKIMYQKELLTALAELLASPPWGPDGLRCLITWSLFRQLLAYVQPRSLVAGKVPQFACYDHVREVMELALTSRYLRSRVSQHAVRRAAAMFETIRDAFGAELRASSWLRGPVRDIALRKMFGMKAHMGSPGQRLDEEYVDQYYAALPDSPTDRFFDTWRKARSVLAHHRWADQKHVFFDISKVNAFYERQDNAIIVSAAMLQPVFFFSDGNAAFNYGGLGDVMGHEMMHGYDVLGTQFDDSGQFNPWNTPESHVQYVNKTRCLREFHNRLLKTTQSATMRDTTFSPRDRHGKRQEAFNGTLDSENLADSVGAVTSYTAFRALASAQRYNTLPWLNLTPEQLFFVGRCAKKCKRDDVTTATRHASSSARCNVPVMNMAAFSEAFGCSRGTRMNPVHKCSFWR